MSEIQVDFHLLILLSRVSEFQGDFHGETLADTTIQQLRKVAYQTFMEQGHRSVDLADPSVDGDQSLMLHYVPITTVAASIFQDSELQDHIHYQPRPVFDGDGERLLFDFPSGTVFYVNF